MELCKRGMTQGKGQELQEDVVEREPDGSVDSYRNYKFCYSCCRESREKNVVRLQLHLSV